MHPLTGPIIFLVCISLNGYTIVEAGYAVDDERIPTVLEEPDSVYPSRNVLDFLFKYYANTPLISWGWSRQEPLDNLRETEEQRPQTFTTGTPKRLYYAPRPGKRSVDDKDSDAYLSSESQVRAKRSVEENQDDITNPDEREKRELASSGDPTTSAVRSRSWTPKVTVRRTAFIPRLGKRGDEDDIIYDTDDNLPYDSDLPEVLEDTDEWSEEPMEEYGEVVDSDLDLGMAPLQVEPRAALVPRLGKKSMSFSPRLGKRPNFIPRLGKRNGFAFSPRLGKRGSFAFSPRLGKRDFAFSPRLGKRGDFAFSPRLGKKADFAFSPRLGKRQDYITPSPDLDKRDFAFSPRLGKRDFAFSPRLGKRPNSFTPRLGKRSLDQTSVRSQEYSRSVPYQQTTASN